MADSGSAIESIIDHQDDEDFPFQLEKTWEDVSEGTLCLVFTFKGVSQVEEDGAFYELKEGPLFNILKPQIKK